VASELEKATGGDPKKLHAAVQKVAQEIIKKHKAIIFNGDNYTAEWHAEAERRGLPNLKNTVAALPALVAPKNLQLFAKYGVLTEREVRSRHDIYVERYCKDINTEALTALSMAKTMILPAAYRYQGQLASTAASLKAVGKAPHLGPLDVVSQLVTDLEQGIADLEGALEHQAEGDLLAHARHFENEVIPAMKSVRESADKLEAVVADDLWPLPTYREMLFIK
jgi:glutamine synthetase